MMKKLMAARLVTRPAIWGRLPAHAGIVSSGVRRGECESWEAWLKTQLDRRLDRRPPASAGLPAAFVLPPGMLQFASKRFVVGVAARSVDRMGRPYPLLVYQLAHPRWVVRHFDTHAAFPRDWFFWLARTVARHAGLFEAADIRALDRATDELWRLHAPSGTQLLPERWHTKPDPAALVLRSRALLDRLMGAAAQDDLARRLAGVRFLPWPDWPERLCEWRRTGAEAHGNTGNFSAEPPDTALPARDWGPFEGAFWQQDDAGGFVNAAVRLDELWNGGPCT